MNNFADSHKQDYINELSEDHENIMTWKLFLTPGAPSINMV